MSNLVETNHPINVSVIINCLNGERYLGEAIDSVYDQTFKNWEIIFWDNASLDNSAKIAASYDSKIKIFKSNKTESLGKARNNAIKKATGDLIAFLDADDKWAPRKLEKQVYLFNNQKVGLVFSRIHHFNISGILRDPWENFEIPTGKVFFKATQI